MPRKQAVYGKQPKATQASTTIFGSPEDSKRKRLDATRTTKEDDTQRKNKSEALVEEKIESPIRPRKALGEITGNAVLHTETRKEKKKSSRRSKKAEKKEPRIKDKAEEKPRYLEDVANIKNTTSGEEQSKCGSEHRSRNKIEARSDEEHAHENGREEENLTEDTKPNTAIPDPIDPPHETGSADAPNDCYTEHCASLLELTSYPVSPFSEWANDLSDDFSLVKIAEASFGEVYRLSLQPEAAEDTDLPLSKNDESVLKVIALTPPSDTLPRSKKDRERALKNAENMSKPADVASELKLLQRLSDIPGFTNFRDLRVLQGRPPVPFADAFKAFNAGQKAAKKELSIFPDPAKKSSYSEDQLWAVIEMQDAGTDLEKLVAKGESSSVWFVWDIFWQVVLALAKGEEEAEFEHRDLHLGNICVRTPAPVDESTIDVSKTFGFTSCEATLIDYTVSRASMIPASMGEDQAAEDGVDLGDSVAYIDLANDPHLFYGDSTQEYQYDIYRYMRGCIYYSSPYASFPNDGSNDANEDDDQNQESSEEEQEQNLPTPPSPEEMAAIERETGHSWRQFRPQTNLCWLHYVLYMLLEQMEWPSSRRAPRGKKAKGEEHARWKRARELENALVKVQEMLDPGWIGEEGGLGRAGEVVAWAVEEGWLRLEDVVGEGPGEFEDFGEEGEEDDGLVAQLQGLALQSSAPEADCSEPASKPGDGHSKKKTAKKLS